MEGGFSKALLMAKEDGTEVVAKLPFSIAGPPRYLTASEAAVLQFFPVPKLLAWNADSSNPVGAEYIIMEKAVGCQLVKRWSEMEDLSHFEFIKNLCKVEADLATLAFPAHGSLYLRESMGAGDRYEPLASERSWFGKDEAESVQARFDRGPWPTLPAFGVALAEREIARIEQNPKVMSHGPPRGSTEEQLAVLRIAREPTQITSLIDWQSIVVQPMFLQVRFPEFTSIGEDYELGSKVPTLPENIEEMDDDDQAITRFEHKQTMMGKAYEAASGFKIKNIFKSLQAWDEGIVPLRICLIAIADVWHEAGFSGDCPCSFTKNEIEKYQQEFQDYRNHHKILELAREYLGADADGWIAHDDDFKEKQQQNKELLEFCIAHCAKYGKSADEGRKIWPF
ncbi:hypothetical protein FB567DRAFT_559894 [Paraphoma chrysanthemicola]|uniref:Aminoglycoside phosphotransferase domain-containing protein n=1 Tax=Paraphoma chrysanthemicola TaxID=798071 RepID=A0A8K0R9X1_9PLEO|nr:hypothetical protein FB567DRAFT_559894 [Paraphoma chrysanthemicola]